MCEHPTDEELVRAALADWQDKEARATSAHLESGCERCANRVKELTVVIRALDAPALAEAPAALNERAAAWLAAQGKVPGRMIMDAIREIRAVLVLDSWSGALLEGIRSSAPAQGRQLMFESPEGDLHLQIEPSDAGSVTIQGQFLPSAPEVEMAGGCAMLEQGSRTETCRLTPHGEFHFSGSGADELCLYIEWNQKRIVVDPIKMMDE